MAASVFASSFSWCWQLLLELSAGRRIGQYEDPIHIHTQMIFLIVTWSINIIVIAYKGHLEKCTTRIQGFGCIHQTWIYVYVSKDQAKHADS
jgi:hypothetical protein